MIYDRSDITGNIRQGDIFMGIPRIEVSLKTVAILDAQGVTQEVDWSTLADRSEEVTAIVPMRSVNGIVITQDCDAVRDTDITLCELRPFEQVYPPAATALKPSSSMKIITKQSRSNLKWFYLPPDESIGLKGRWAIDFSICIRVPRTHLESLKSRRKARLNVVAYEHFREKLSEYFRRYPYDEWYPLNREEYSEYLKEYNDAEPFPWHKENETST